MADINEQGMIIRSYIWGPGVDNLLSMTVYTGSTPVIYYPLKDHLGTIHALANSYGTVVESYSYNAWGEVLGVYDKNGNHITESNLGNRYLWQGREYHWKTGLYYFRARWYDPVTGRWLSNDPIGISGGLNQYVFCGNNPVNFRDPSGRYAHIVIGAVIGGVAGGIGGAISGDGVGRGIISGAAGGAVFAATFNPALSAATAAGLGTIGAGIAAGATAGAASGLATGVIKESFDVVKPNGRFSMGDVGGSIGVGTLTGGVLGPIGSLNTVAVAEGSVSATKAVITEQTLNFDVNLYQELFPDSNQRKKPCP
jgi:RHS repeat-associated protein